MPVLYESLSKSQADLCVLVLTASRIPIRLVNDENGYNIWVSDDKYRQARLCMENYFNENKEMPAFPEQENRVSHGAILSSVIAAFILLAIHVEVITSGKQDAVINRFGASASRIMHGDVYRAITALLLHANALHLAGNMIGVIIFGIAVCAVCGWGVGWLMIFMSGVFGNLINAFMYESGHISIGASTAIFGAVGILSGYQLIKRHKFYKRRFASWAPLAGGLALLGLLGVGPNSDIAAHFFGFVSGIGMGLIYAILFHFPPRTLFQIISGSLVIFFIAVAWLPGL